MAHQWFVQAAKRMDDCCAGFPNLSPWQSRIKAVALPCLSMTVESTESPLPPRGSRLGGKAYVRVGTIWPHSPDRPMGFIGQLDFAALAELHHGELPELPTDRVLALFCDLEHEPSGFDPNDRDFWWMVYTRTGGIADDLSPPEIPDVSGAAKPLKYKEPVPGCVFKGWVTLSLPSPFDAAFDFLRGENAVEPDPPGDYWNLYYDCYNDQLLKPKGQSHQVLGHPHWVKPDSRVIAQLASKGIYCGRPENYKSPRALELRTGANDWRRLWENGSDTVAYYRGYGSLFVLIRDDDLRARALDECWVFAQTT
jgi:hypothetical protein